MQPSKMEDSLVGIQIGKTDRNLRRRANLLRVTTPTGRLAPHGSVEPGLPVRFRREKREREVCREDRRQWNPVVGHLELRLKKQISAM